MYYARQRQFCRHQVCASWPKLGEKNSGYWSDYFAFELFSAENNARKQRNCVVCSQLLNWMWATRTVSSIVLSHETLHGHLQRVSLQITIHSNWYFPTAYFFLPFCLRSLTSKLIWEYMPTTFSSQNLLANSKSSNSYCIWIFDSWSD